MRYLTVFVSLALSVPCLVADVPRPLSPGETAQWATVYVTLDPHGACAAGVCHEATDGTQYIWTCQHVARYGRGNDYLPVENFRGDVSPAEVVAVAEDLDLALLRVVGHLDLASADVSTLDPPLVGSAVVHCGSPEGLRHSVLHGIVSYIGRHRNGETRDQIDAPAGPGSSGGPVFDDRGRCLGIVTSCRRTGICFYLPTRSIVQWALMHQWCDAVE